jgi:uncharacterized protein
MGVPQDDKEAFRWFRLAAETGWADAQTKLGEIYQNGWGVPKDYDEAVKMYRLAATQGNATAQSSLGGMYANGQGVPQDYVLSYMWLSVGKTNLADVAHNMSPEQIDLAQKMARRCEESNYKQCGDQFSASATSVPMRKVGGIYVVPRSHKRCHYFELCR